MSDFDRWEVALTLTVTLTLTLAMARHRTYNDIVTCMMHVLV